MITLSRRRTMGKKEEEIYDPTGGYLIADFTITEAATLPIAGRSTKTYITEIIVDGVAQTIVNNATYNFTAGNHIVKWNVGETIYVETIPVLREASSNIFTKKCVYIPSHVTSMERLSLRANPFYGVTNATIYAKEPPIGFVNAIGLWYIGINAPLYVPKGSEDAYTAEVEKVSYWHGAVKTMTIPTPDSENW